MDFSELAHRFQHHPPKDEATVRSHQSIRENALVLAAVVEDEVPDSDEKKEAIKKIEEAMMWANAGIARQQ